MKIVVLVTLMSDNGIGGEVEDCSSYPSSEGQGIQGWGVICIDLFWNKSWDFVRARFSVKKEIVDADNSLNEY